MQNLSKPYEDIISFCCVCVGFFLAVKIIFLFRSCHICVWHFLSSFTLFMGCKFLGKAQQKLRLPQKCPSRCFALLLAAVASCSTHPPQPSSIVPCFTDAPFCLPCLVSEKNLSSGLPRNHIAQDTESRIEHCWGCSGDRPILVAFVLANPSLSICFFWNPVSAW